MNKRIFGFALGALLLALCASAEAQLPKKVYRIGYLSEGLGIEPREEAFQRGLRDLGYIDGQNLVIEWKFAKRKRGHLPDFAAELADLKVDCIITVGTEPTRVAKQATQSIPIVMINVGDAVERGFVTSLARPGGIITGFTTLSPELSDKRLELLKEALPKLSRITVLWDPSRLGTDAHVKETEIAAHALGVQLQTVEVRRAEDIDAAFQAARKRGLEAFMVLGAGFQRYEASITSLPVKYRLPVMYSDPRFVLAGGLMSYAANLVDSFRRAAVYVDKILKGTKPADLPVQQPMKFEL
jgi:putative ABC transport system substrate-binding protein